LATAPAGLQPHGIVVDSANVFWTNNGATGSVMSAAIGGVASPTTIATGQANPEGIALDGMGSVFWANDAAFPNSAIMKCPTTGTCKPFPVVSIGGASPWGLVIDGTDLYATYGKGVVWTSTVTMGLQSVADKLAGPLNIATDGTDLYWTDKTAGAVMKCRPGSSPIDAGPKGCVPTMLAAGQNGPWGIVATVGNVYWTNVDAVMGCATSGCSSPTTVAKNLMTARGIAVQGAFVYWVDQGLGTVSKCAGSTFCATPTVLAHGQSAPYGIAVDATNVYWTNSGDGTVMQLTPN
jgi:hypothetical protein